MAKNKKQELPSVAGPSPVSPIGTEEPKQEPAKMERPTVTIPKSEIQIVTLKIPLSDVSPTSYQSNQISVKGLTRKQKHNLKRLVAGLEDGGAKLENGKHVNGTQPAICYLLEQME